MPADLLPFYFRICLSHVFPRRDLLKGIIPTICKELPYNIIDNIVEFCNEETPMSVQPVHCIIVVNLDLTFWSDKLFYDSSKD